MVQKKIKVFPPTNGGSGDGDDLLQQVGDDESAVPPRWTAAAVRKREQVRYGGPIKPTQQQGSRQQQQNKEKVIPKPRVCNVIFPHVKTSTDKTTTSLLNGDESYLPTAWAAGGGSANSSGLGFSSPISIGGVMPQKASRHLPLASAPDPFLLRQSGRHPPRPEALIVHPQGFRILKNRSVMERSLRSYFRLPPAPSAYLTQERMRAQRQLLTVEIAEDEEESRFFGATVDGPLGQQPIGSSPMQRCMLLDGFMLLCAGGKPEPEAVEAVTLQCSHLVGVIEDDLMHFLNLRFLDLSENELLLEHLLSLTSLEVLHLAYNKINTLAGVTCAVEEQQQMQETNGGTGRSSSLRCSATHDSTSIRSAAAYYAQEKQTRPTTTTTMTGVRTDDDVHHRAPRSRHSGGDKCSNSSGSGHPVDGIGYYSPHQKPIRRVHQVSECSLHDVLLPNLHALNLSFNNIPPGDILHLSYFPFLEKLDLSGNNLRTLPEDLAGLTSVTHLALERNQLRDGKTIFAALSTMPALIEVNLNHNELRHVPPLSVKDGRGLCFPTIEVIGLGHNRFSTLGDVVALSELVRTLQRVVLAGNPIARKRKERGATQAHFAQAVMNLYWEQAGIRSSGEYGGASYFYGGPLHNESALHTPEHREHQRHEGENDVDVSDEQYHGLDSLIDSWRQYEERGLNSKNSSYRRRTDQFHEEGESFYADEDGKGASFDHTASSAQIPPPFSLSLDEGSTLNNIFWYGDAEPPSAPRMTTADDNHAAPRIPTPSLLRFVELVFDDTVMRKQKPSYFYAKRRQLVAENEGQKQLHHHPIEEESALPSWMVHPKTGLVTVPNYSEFMDIYRLIDESAKSLHGSGKRSYNTTAHRRQRKRMADIVVPPKPEDEEEEEEKKETDASEAVPAQAAELQGDETDDSDADASSCRSVSSRDVVFMTGVALQEDDGDRAPRKKKGKKKEEVWKQQVQEDLHPVKEENISGEANRQKQQKQKHFHQRSSPNRPTRDSSPQAADPPSTNVRILMNELRRMLRRPLPPLPPASSRQATSGNAQPL
ncbi:putative leucine-rich repeat protein (LRRP) [Trypanosoma grayi]|uniref:putative leucine-rich repeat protein (LRRP) n=1 Tax=Trypanosoma grayi TaxID=71804 RepID=UPI0004F416C7|nr:putative leucine-rich repeat protein (LRRP) [Trypanosoma grayi]KEG12664.1 putative leucine-rich repeat protein (LRRP) [Trypanosoma grayi]